jgi:hypothetical protein
MFDLWTLIGFLEGMGIQFKSNCVEILGQKHLPHIILIDHKKV